MNQHVVLGRTYKGKCRNSGIKGVEICILSVILTDCVTLDKSLSLAGPQFPHMYNFSNYTIRAG